ncbi:DNA-binding anti-repressor SinI [Anaerobacillus sp. CMMVII]|nr:DNA-binding anti-repressor SinI [Anaerobacillus sp. CMMVII]
MNKFVLVTNYQELDQEWVSLMKSAKDLGLRPDDIKLFLKQLCSDQAKE